MSLNISELLNPSSPAPRLPHPSQPSEERSIGKHPLQASEIISTSPDSSGDNDTMFHHSSLADADHPPRSPRVVPVTLRSADIRPLSAGANQSPQSLATGITNFASQNSPPTPVEPSPELERQATSPTLEQFHHPSSPGELKHRQSASIARVSPSATLPPIQSPALLASSGYENKAAVKTEHVHNDSNQANRLPTEDWSVNKIKEENPQPSVGGLGINIASNSTTGPAPMSTAEEYNAALPSTEDGHAEGAPTTKKVANLKRGNSRASSADMSSPTRSTPTPKGAPKPTAENKPKKKSAEKKGIARPSTAVKRKLEDDDAASSARRTGSPASSRASKPPTAKSAKLSQSVASSPPAPEDGDDVDDDDIDENQLFCICRRPDDHSYMIACDGPCDDWYHGKCVDIRQEDGDLIDKYYCPNCTEKGYGDTTWKRMCRLKTCRKPVSPGSKYCSDAHGILFMEQKLGLARQQDAAQAKKRRKSNYKEHFDVEDDDDYDGEDKNDMDYEESSCGGVLKPGELKTLINSVKNVKEFRALGSRPSIRKHSSRSKNSMATNGTSSAGHDDEVEEKSTVPPHLDPALSFNPSEREQLDKIAEAQARIAVDHERFARREKLLTQVHIRGKQALAILKSQDKGLRDICGYDSRLSMCDEEFDQWCDSPAGKEALEGGNVKVTLGSPAPVTSDKDQDKMEVDGGDEDGRLKGICLRKKCVQHNAYLRLHRDECAKGRSDLAGEKAALEKEYNGIVQRAEIRAIEEGSPSAFDG